MARNKYANSDHLADFETLWTIFLDMVRQYSTRIIAFADALDECTTQRQAFLDALRSLPEDIDIRFCVTSRNYPNIDRAFTDLNSLKFQKVGMTPEDDITKYLQASVDKHEELHSYRKDILEKVPRHGTGIFRYAVRNLNVFCSD
ncbi:hypothetical protein FN846DRAFT_889164 [Sphaerosporella brunnea]|uniref:Nephrocystin 3-like N-terminal domain-containing protein n=1 Tax=Sphaerosporella brunnea TaxID=1250544 RepID=A0A5J5F045_9PEZI|nr:hypothetical protein FN846DRAFT_889164 [Sphaerosporella brunnea]